MATRMNLMTLLQEVRGMAELPNQHPPKAIVGPLLLQQFIPKFRTPGAKRTLTVIVQDPPDIPHPVKIIYVTATSGPAFPAQF